MKTATSVILGAVTGALFGAFNLIVTFFAPLLDDSPLTLAIFYGPMFLIWGFHGFMAYRGAHRVTEAIKAGSLIAFVTFVVFDLFVILRVNLFLDELSRRPDWQNLVARYLGSGSRSLRAYANYVYLTGSPFRILAASVLGAFSGLIGGLLASLGRQEKVRV